MVTPNEHLYMRAAQFGSLCIALGALNLVNPIPGVLNQGYGLMLCMSGAIIQVQALRLRHHCLLGRRSGRYGQRGPYKKSRLFERIEQVFDDESGRYYKSWLRLDKSSFDRLLHLIKDDEVFKSKGRKPQLPVHYQLAAYLIRFGSTTGTKTSWAIEVSEGSIYKCCKRVTRALRRLRPAYIRWPTAEEKIEIKLAYQDEGFPGAIGAIDGTYIQLLDKPRARPMGYLCRKKFWAVNLLVVVDVNGRIIFYDLGWPGSMPDVSIWKRCHLWRYRTTYLAEDEWLIGDKGFTLSQWLIAPFQELELRSANARDSRRMKRWNKSLASQRIVVKHTFGCLKARFAYLQGIRGSDIRNIYRVIDSLLVLHNILLEFGDLAEDLGPAEAAQVMHKQAERRLQGEEMELELAVSDATSAHEVLEVGEDRREQLLEYWLEHQRL